jgi:hypothetical protein
LPPGYQVAEEHARDRRNLVLELNPASHSLSELRQELLAVVNIGVFDHTIAAFWRYILYAEIVLKIREVVLPKARYDLKLLNSVKEVEEHFKLSEEIVAGDYTSRFESAVRSIIGNLKGTASRADIRHQLTNLLFDVYDSPQILRS